MEKMSWHEKKEFGFSIPFCCWESDLPKFIFPSHWHECYELVTVLAGKVQVKIDGDVWEAFPGDIVAINPGQVHSFPTSENETQLRFFQFEAGVFSEDAMVAFGKTLFSRKPVLRGGEYPDRDAADEPLYRQIYGILADLLTEYREQKKGYRLAIKAKLCLLALAYHRDRQSESSDLQNVTTGWHTSFVTDQRMERVYQLIFKNFDNADLNLEQAARAAALSPSYFSRLFKEQIGRSFYDYLSTVRVSHAMEFLITSDLPVSLIADKCGFDSLPTFHRVFKAEAGCTPAAYRKKMKLYDNN
jgi:AraC-like DNA-binding protein